jgi:hypothetical protein
MITQQDLEQLEAFDGRGARILSVYLDLDPDRQVRRSCRVVFEDLVKDVGARLPEPARDDLTREVGRVQEWLTSEPHGKAVALFSCQARGLWQVHLLAVHAEDHLAFELMPDLAPLLRLLDEHERYAVALVDKEKARLFSVFLGEIEVERQVEREAEERLFAELLELAGPGGRATLGVRSYVRRAVG